MYTDRLRLMKYISPSGAEFTLDFESLSRTGGKKAPVSEFPGQNQGAVQDLGNTTEGYPITCTISGPDYDTQADPFAKALGEPGPGKLVHPRWGNLNVLPSTWEQHEQFVSGTMRAVFTIQFIRVDAAQFIYTTAVTDNTSKVIASTDSAVTDITGSVPDEITDAKTLAGTIENVQAGMKKISGAFNKITGLTEDVSSSISQAVTDIDNNVSALVQAPADLMTAVLTLYRLPARIVTDVDAKIRGYQTIYTDLIDGYKNTTQKYGESFGLIAAGNLNGLAIAAAEATTAGGIPTRTKAAEIITALQNLSGSINDSIEDLESLGDFTADYDSQVSTALAISSALNGLINNALNLPAERVMTLDREVDPYTLCFELYGNLDSFDTFMEYNGFADDDICLIPRGKVVRWYE